MKKVLPTILEPARVALLLALAIGLGFTVHPVFFLAALLFAAAALVLLTIFEPARMDVMLGLAIGLGFQVHEIFFPRVC